MDSPTTSNATTDEALAESNEPVGYSRVTHEKALEIIQLRRAKPDIQGREIAALVGVAPSTVSRWLKLLTTDTVPEARQLAKSQALRGTMKLADQVEHSDPRVSQGAAKALVALAGVAETTQQVQVGVQVVVGQVGQPAGDDPFVMANSTPVIEP